MIIAFVLQAVVSV